MVLNDLSDLRFYNLKVTDLDNIFKLHVDSNGNLVFNLNETMYLNFDDSVFDEYIVDHPLHWSIISYKLYGTTRLAWLLMKINNVKPNEMFHRVKPTTRIKYLEKGTVQQIINYLNEA